MNKKKGFRAARPNQADSAQQPHARQRAARPILSAARPSSSPSQPAPSFSFLFHFFS
jgi:hypothetical protein